ncbi:MAG: hypothetical protein ABSD82_05890 [Solirubrobacteraceae bacterium]
MLPAERATPQVAAGGGAPQERPRRPRRTLPPYWWAAAAALAIALAVGLAVIVGGARTGSVIVPPANEHDVTSWAPPGTRPLPDAQAAALVARQPENRPANAAANDYVPTNAELAAFHVAQKAARAQGVFNPLTRYVTGRPGIRDPTTDELIQWVSHKWGIPTNWIRAQMVVESDWQQSQLGDATTVSASWARLYPTFSRLLRSNTVYESLGIAQDKWVPNGSIGAGTEPLRWKSTAFSLDYYAATVRYYFDGYCSWCSAGYRGGEEWNSVGAWYSPQPWGNAAARSYIRAVQAALAQHPWTRPGF